MFESSYVFETNDAAPQDEHKRATTNQNSEDENLTESSNRSGKERSSESQRNSTNLQLNTAEVQTVVGADDSSITIQELLATSDTTGSIADKRGHEDKSEESDESVSGVENKVDSKFSGEEHSTTTVIHQEYHIDLSALSDADLAAVRSHLDDMFSEFDSRGSGALQQDDVRRLILQWAAEPDGNIKSKGLVALPMLPPSSLSRDEVIAFINHLDSDQNGEIELEEFASFVLEGMSLDPEDRRLYGMQSSLHSKLMAIIENVERRLVTILMRVYKVNNDNFDSDEKEDWGENDVETTEKRNDGKSDLSSGHDLDEEAAGAQKYLQEEKKDSLKEEEYPPGVFQVTDEHTKTFLRALFKEYDVEKTGNLTGENIQALMRNFSKGEPRFDVTDDEVVTFISAMDKDGDGRVSMIEMEEFFKLGISLSESKGRAFSERSPMHGKIWRVFCILKLQLEHRTHSIHSLFSKYASDKGHLERSGLQAILQHIQVSPPATEAQLDLFVNALDSDGDGCISQDEMMTFCINGISQSDTKRKAFAARSTFHAHLVSLFQYLDG
jgi:Ca2+-binding EF-hand superfamily protein